MVIYGGQTTAVGCIFVIFREIRVRFSQPPRPLLYLTLFDNVFLSVLDVYAAIGQPCHLNAEQTEESVVPVWVVVAVDGCLNFILVSFPFKIIRLIVIGISVDVILVDRTTS